MRIPIQVKEGNPMSEVNETGGRDRQQVWDPLRRKAVALTPEERVRQWFIGVLHDECGVPLHSMMSETSFRYGQKQFRADIIVWAKDLTPAVVVECKRPEVALGQAVLDQVAEYDLVLGVRWVIVTNGASTLVWRRKVGVLGTGVSGAFEQSSALPLWSEIRIK